ncbi:MAG: trypsin-like peptidase domain-containing protein [Actinobacteria bacterium]|nr:trypsin-like peptidase domain-containing protein [Actinomycetota bacterium]
MSDNENTHATGDGEPVWRLAEPETTQEPEWSTVQTVEPPPPSLLEGVPDLSRRSPLVLVFIAALIGAIIGSGTTIVATHNSAGGGTVKVAPPVKASDNGAESVAAVAKAVLPSIVRIDVAGSNPFGADTEGTGSGVIYRADGYIVTNNHVVENADEVRVTLSDGTASTARVVGTAAPAVDIAVVKIDRSGLPAATFGSTKDLEVGQLAVAIGSPFGLQGTVTSGVLSALHRNISIDPTERFSDAIQTDAPINPGNSGGALSDGRGRVIGINTAILSGGGGNVGVGFAIPIEIVRRVADQVIDTGHARLPFLGISGQNLPDNKGALIQDVVAGGPAADAGLKTGDIITSIDGTRIRSMDDLIAVLLTKDVGQVVRVGYTRDGKARTASARLVARTGG